MSLVISPFSTMPHMRQPFWVQPAGLTSGSFRSVTPAIADTFSRGQHAPQSSTVVAYYGSLRFTPVTPSVQIKSIRFGESPDNLKTLAQAPYGASYNPETGKTLFKVWLPVLHQGNQPVELVLLTPPPGLMNDPQKLQKLRQDPAQLFKLASETEEDQQALAKQGLQWQKQTIPMAKITGFTTEHTANPTALNGNIYTVQIDNVPPGALYMVRFARPKNVDKNPTDLEAPRLWPDPFARQIMTVHGPSVVPQLNYTWQHPGWQRPFDPRQTIAYRMHVGTFTQAGTFEAAAEQMAYLKKLGVNTLDVLPVMAGPGDRGWTYDPAMHLALMPAYGTPNQYAAMIDAAHGNGIAVVQDVSYNHVSPEGFYLNVFDNGAIDKREGDAPWGDPLNFDNDTVANMVNESLRQYLQDFKADGLRFDMTQQMAKHLKDTPFSDQLEATDRILRRITGYIHELAKKWGISPLLIAEDARLQTNITQPLEAQSSQQAGLGFDHQYAFDFHHYLSGLVTGVPHKGWVLPGPFGFHTLMQQYLTKDFPGKHLSNSYHFSESHDEISNGDRMGYRMTEYLRLLSTSQGLQQLQNEISEKYNKLESLSSGGEEKIALEETKQRLLGALPKKPIHYPDERAIVHTLFPLLIPGIPRLFMGQEYGEDKPFYFFANHADPAAVAGSRLRGDLQDPQALETFNRSKLNFSTQIEASSPRPVSPLNQASPPENFNQRLFRLTQKLIAFRLNTPAMWQGDEQEMTIDENHLKNGVFVIRRKGRENPDSEVIIVVNTTDKTYAQPDLLTAGRKIKPPVYGGSDYKVEFKTGLWHEIFSSDQSSGQLIDISGLERVALSLKPWEIKIYEKQTPQHKVLTSHSRVSVIDSPAPGSSSPSPE